MNDETIAQTVLFADVFDKPLVASFDQAHASSDGGAVLLKAADRRLGLTAALAAALPDTRHASWVQHSIGDLLRQRVFGIACGHPDANDADALAEDPIHKLLLDRDPITGTRLASQPTVSRFEHTATPRALYRMGTALMETVVARHRRRKRRTRRITIDVDVTEDPTHGAQQGSFFNGFYDGWCYLPLVVTLTFDDEPRQYVVAAILRPGNAATAVGVQAVLRRLIPLLWRAFRGVRVRVRMDAGFATPEIFDELDLAGVEYVVAIAKNTVLTQFAAADLAALRPLVRQHEETQARFGEATYQARRWARPRRVIFKAEVVWHAGRAPKDNPRFVITNLQQSPEWIYRQIYCARGDSENRLKELHHDLAFGRTSCTRFWPNQLRVLLSVAAFVLLQELQLRADRTALAGAQVARLRQALITLGVRVTRSVRRIVLHLPRSHPERTAWRRIAVALGATTA